MKKIPTAIVVDDDRDLVESFCEYLKIVDVNVVGHCHNGKTAIELYLQKSPDIVFLDLVMPEYDGFFALEGIKSMDPAAKVVVLTANNSAPTMERLQGLKPHRVLFKPFEIDKIIDSVEDMRKPQLVA